MRIKSTTSGRHAVTELSRSTGTAFQHACFDYLRYVYPGIIDALPLKVVDRYGLDIYLLSGGPKWDFKLGYQCKGFETRFEQSQYNQCKKSIQALRDSNKKVQQFYMVVNLKGQHYDLALRRQLDADLQQLVTDKIAEHAELLDVGNFIEYVSKLIIDLLYKKIDKANRRFSKDYLETMHQVFYYKPVPFFDRERRLTNPEQFVFHSIALKAQSVHPDKKMQFFVVSEFGFGKTSLLMQLFRAAQAPYRCLYIPVALFPVNALRHQTLFYERMLEIIEGQPLDFQNPLPKLAARLLNYLLQYNGNKNILLLDGLDENENLYRLDTLKDLMTHMNLLKASVVLGVRKEMWDERNGNFSMALGTQPNHKEIILTEWGKKEIMEYLQMFTRQFSVVPDYLQEFTALVAANQYEAFYGDIPKRPLFLEMILADISIHGIRNRNISELYYDFFEKKFSIDRMGSFSQFTVSRPASATEDAFELLGLYFTILARIAVRMVVGVDAEKNMIVRNYIEEFHLKEIMKDLGLAGTKEIVLNSVLIPSGVRTGKGLSLKFAHRSFQEFFFARGINNHLQYQLVQQLPLDDLDVIHSDGVNRFLTGFLQTEFSDFQRQTLLLTIQKQYSGYHTESLAAIIVREITN